LWIDAITLATDLKIPTYDCPYLAVAMHEKATLLSLDQKLIVVALELFSPRNMKG